MASLLTLDNAVFSSYVFCSAVVLLKTLMMAVYTAKFRTTKQVYLNPEDTKLTGNDKLKPILDDPDVERVRRNHLNDIENVLPFVLIGLLYVLTGPGQWMAIMHFRVFMVSRIIYTICYQVPIPQPSRALCWFVGLFVCISMAVQLLMASRF